MKRLKILIIAVLTASILAGCSITEMKEAYKKKDYTETDYTEGLVEVGDSSTEFILREGSTVNHDKLTEVVGSKVIYLYLDNSLYYPVLVPDNLEYVTDNSKYIYAKDGSLNITVLSGVDVYNFADFVSIKNGEALTPTMIVSSKDNKGILEAALYVVNDKAIIARTYNNSKAFEIIREGLANNTYRQSIYSDILIDEELTQFGLPVYSDFETTVTLGLGDSAQKIYAFESDSCLTISRELRKYEDSIEKNSIRLAVMACSDLAHVYFNGENIFYIEIGDYVFGAYRVNFNTTLTCFGYGDEAKHNTVVFLKGQEGD